MIGLQRTRLKYVAAVNASALSEDTPDDFKFTYVDIGNVTQGSMNLETPPITFAEAPSRARRLAAPGDSVVSTVRTYLRAVATVPDFSDPLVFSTGFAVLHPKRELFPRFLSWYLQGDEFVSRIEANSTGVSYPAIASGQLMALDLHLPSYGEQRAIADYLDRETARIDAVIEEQQQLIDLLGERRQALVEHSVTRGLDGRASLKPSTLSWTDTVPAQWAVANIRRFAEMKTGHTPSRSVPEYWENCAIPWFTLADVWQLRDARRMYLGETSNLISEVGLANSAAELLPTGTVVLSRTASVGFTGIMPTAMATSQDFWNWVCGPDLIPEFLVYVFRAMRKEFHALMIGSTHKTIYQPVAAAIRIPVPPSGEQRSIVVYLDQQTAKIDTLIAETGQFIQLARERRSALITAAVTGEIDVQEVA